MVIIAISLREKDLGMQYMIQKVGKLESLGIGGLYLRKICTCMIILNGCNELKGSPVKEGLFIFKALFV